MEQLISLGTLLRLVLLSSLLVGILTPFGMEAKEMISFLQVRAHCTEQLTLEEMETINYMAQEHKILKVRSIDTWVRETKIS